MHSFSSCSKYLLFSSLLLPYFALHAQGSAQPEPVDQELCRFNSRERAFANLEFLYWTVDEGALEYAIRNKSAAWGPTPAFAKGHYKLATFDWAPGLRLAAGYYNSPKYWEMIGQYTWIYVSGSNQVHSPSTPNEFIEATWNEFTPTPLAKAKSHIDLHYHVGDALVTRVFDPNPHLRMRIMGGLTTAWIEQRWKVHYSNATNHDNIKNHWKYFAGGLRAGFSVDWFWGYRFYLAGKTTFATLIGSYKNRVSQKTTFAPTGADDVNIPVRNILYEDHRFAFHAQMLVGPSYQQAFNCFDLEIFAGYEFNVWMNLQEVYRSAQTAPGAAKENKLSTGTLGLQGLTLRMTLGF